MRRAIFILAVLVTSMTLPSAQASICADVNHCTFDFDIHNVGPTTFGSGSYGTVDLLKVGSTIQITIDLAPGFGLINTGFPNGGGTKYAFAFNDNLAAANFAYGSYNPVTYSGGTTAAGSYQFDGFGDFERAAATTDLPNSGGANVVSFIVTRTGGLRAFRTSSA